MKVSIIVPVYNVEEYIARCLDSILGQTHHEIEVIIVNDGSPDNSGAICERYAAEDSRIKCLYKANGGLSSARNFGLRHATGEYVMFVDSDDWIEQEACETLLAHTQGGRIDMVFASYFKNYTNLQVEKPIISTSEEVVSYTKEEVRNELLRRIFGLFREELAHPEHMDSLVTAWMKLYKRSLIKDKEFVDTNKFGTEDALWNISVLLEARSAVYVNKSLYHYWKNNKRSLTSGGNRSIYYKWKRMHARMGKYIEENKLGEVFSEALGNRIALSVIGIGLETVRSRKPLGFKTRFLKEVLTDSEYSESLKNLRVEFMPLKWKVFFTLARYRASVPIYGMLSIINKIVSR